MNPLEWLTSPWPWYVSGPLIGLIVPALLLLGNKSFGVSSNLRHACAMLPARAPFFRYDWRSVGGWNLAFAAGIMLGGFLGGVLLANPEPLRLAAATEHDLANLAIDVSNGIAPAGLFSLAALGKLKTWLILLAGGLLVGFGAQWAGGCNSGHAISGLSNLQLPSLVAAISFFAGGLVMTNLLLPLLF